VRTKCHVHVLVLTTERSTEHVEESVDEEITVSIAGVTLQNVDIVTRYVCVFDEVSANFTACAASPLCIIITANTLMVRNYRLQPHSLNINVAAY